MEHQHIAHQRGRAGARDRCGWGRAVVRIALVPLDGRPPSWQFPQRIAAIAGDEVVRPLSELLGTLHKGADQRTLLNWLVEVTREADAAVISWDALVYGGLVQSRAQGESLPMADWRALNSVDGPGQGTMATVRAWG